MSSGITALPVKLSVGKELLGRKSSLLSVLGKRTHRKNVQHSAGKDGLDFVSRKSPSA